MRILVVDANERGRSELAALLTDAGADVAMAADGLEALEHVSASPPHLVVSEILMPRMDGYALCRELRRRNAAPPLVFYTGAATGPEDARFALALGAAAFIEKTADSHALHGRLRELLVPRTNGPGAASARLAEMPEVEYLREHNRRLSAMLSRKMLALEQTNAELAARAAYLRRVIETQPQCVVVVASDGSLIEMNSAGLRLIEAEALAHAQQQSIQALVAEEDRAAFGELTRHVFRGESRTLEFRLADLKGGRRWVEMHAGPLRDESGAVTAMLGTMRDISTRKRALEALQEAEGRLHLALDAGRIGVWDWDMETGKVVWSPRHEEFWGMTPGTFRGTYEEFDARLHPDDRAGLNRAVAEAITGRRAYRHEFRVVWPDGTVRWIVGRGEPLFDAAGKPIRMIGTVTDITDRRLTEQALRDSSTFNEQIIRSAQEGIIVLDHELHYAVWNPFMERLSGITAAEVLGKHPLEVFPQLRDAGVIAALERALTGEIIQISDTPVTSPRTGQHWVASVHGPLRSATGEITGVIVTLHDVTERKRAEEALRENQRMLATLLANLIGVAYRSLNDQQWTVEFFSDGVLALTGYPASDFIGNAVRAYADVIHPDDRDRVWNEVQAALAERHPFQVVYRIRTASGEEKWVWDQGRGIYDPNGELRFIEGFCADITEQRRAEQALRENQRMLATLLANLIGVVYRSRNDEHWTTEFFSDGIVALTGYPGSDFIGNAVRAYADLIHPDDRDRVWNDVQAALAARRPFQTVYRIRAASGEEKWILDQGRGVYDADGTLLFIEGFGTDITEHKRAEEALRESQRMMATLLANLPGFAYRCRNDERWTVEFASDGMRALTGYPPSDFVDNAVRSYADLMHPDERERVWQDVQAAMAAHRPFQLVYRIRAASGEEKWVWEQGRGVYGTNGALLFLEGFVTDITERHQAEEKVQRLNRVYAMLSGIDALIVRAHGRDELFQEACRLAVEAGRFPIAWIGMVERAEMRVRPVAWSGAERGLLQAIEPRLSLRPGPDGGRMPVAEAVENQRPLVVNDVTRDARIVLREPVVSRDIRSFAVLPLVIGGETAAVLALLAREPGFFDDTEMRLLTELAGDIAFALDHIDKEERINYLAYYDSLTGLANRTLFHERLAQFVHAAEREREMLALCIMDLDHFKTINDALGRHTGDLLLVELARRLSRCLPDATQIARLGADRFAIVLPQIKNEHQVVQLLEETVLLGTRQPFVLNHEELRISVKLGIALYPNDGTDADTMFRNSEAALKKAKTSGERSLFYTERMTGRVAEQLALENKLRSALEKAELVLHYQPKVDAATRRIVGLEALLRWMDPDNGLVLPMQFIPLMEETGLIVEVGAWVIRQAANDYRNWRSAGLNAPPIAVNVSAVQLRQRDFLDIVRNAVAGLPPPAPLELEITESVLMESIEENVERVKGIHALGVNITIDDFGTGYSSLGYLARLPTQVLKIDLSFVARMLIERDVMTLVSTIISLAHSLRLEVVAEGVETERQADVLQQLKCDILQGNLISPPVSREQIAALLPPANPRGTTPGGTRRTGSGR